MLDKLIYSFIGVTPQRLQQLIIINIYVALIFILPNILTSHLHPDPPLLHLLLLIQFRAFTTLYLLHFCIWWKAPLPSHFTIKYHIYLPSSHPLSLSPLHYRPTIILLLLITLILISQKGRSYINSPLVHNNKHQQWWRSSRSIYLFVYYFIKLRRPLFI